MFYGMFHSLAVSLADSLARANLNMTAMNFASLARFDILLVIYYKGVFDEIHPFKNRYKMKIIECERRRPLGHTQKNKKSTSGMMSIISSNVRLMFARCM